MKLVEKEAAVMVEDKDAMNELVKKVKSLIDDTQLQENLKVNIKKLSVLNADEIVATEILNCLN